MSTTTRRRLGQLLAPALVALLVLGAPVAASAAGRPPAGVLPITLQQESSDDIEFVTIGDAAGIITLEVPVTWEDVAENEWTNEEDDPIGIQLTAAPDLQAFYDEWGVPGVVVSYSEVLPEEMNEEELLDTVDYSEACTAGERDTLPDGELVGIYQLWEACDGGETAALVTVLRPAEGPDYLVLLEIYMASEEDAVALDRILETLLISGPDGSAGDEIVLADLVDTSDLIYQYEEVKNAAVVALFPDEYSDTESALWENSDGEALGFTYTAAPDIDAYFDTWTTPGVLVKSALALEETLDVDEMLQDEELEELCTYDDRYTETHELGDFVYDVAYDRYEQCGDSDSVYIVLIAQSDPVDQLLFADFLLVDEADEEAFEVFRQSFYVDPVLASDTSSETDDAGAFVEIVDETDTIRVRVPESWTEVASEAWDLGDGPIGVSLSAAPDLAGFNDSWDVPGVFVGVSDELAGELTTDEVLDAFDYAEDCSYDARYEYTTEALEGAYDVWLDCGEIEGNTFVVLSAVPAGADEPIILLYMGLPTEEDATAFTEVLDSLAIAGAVEATAPEATEELLATPLAVVQVDRLNVRSGPGTGFNRVSVVTRDTALVVDGQVDDCAWLKVTTQDGVEGWVSGSSDFVALDTRCSEIPEVETPDAPAAAPAPAAGNTTSGAAAGGNAGQGCYLFNNGYGVELNFTFTDSNGKGTTFKVPEDGSVEKCLAPGKYTYTLDAPPPWSSVNGEFTVEAGDNVQYDLYP